MTTYSPGTTRDIEEFAQATVEARARRAVVAAQIASLVESYDVQGSARLASHRIREVVAAERHGDPVLLRVAVMEAAASLGAWAADLDESVARTPMAAA